MKPSRPARSVLSADSDTVGFCSTGRHTQQRVRSEHRLPGHSKAERRCGGAGRAHRYEFCLVAACGGIRSRAHVCTHLQAAHTQHIRFGEGAARARPAGGCCWRPGKLLERQGAGRAADSPRGCHSILSRPCMQPPEGPTCASPPDDSRWRSSAGRKRARVLSCGFSCLYLSTTASPSPVSVVNPALRRAERSRSVTGVVHQARSTGRRPLQFTAALPCPGPPAKGDAPPIPQHFGIPICRQVSGHSRGCNFQHRWLPGCLPGSAGVYVAEV